MKQVKAFPKRAGFFWAFILNRRERLNGQAHQPRSIQEPTISVVIPALNEAENLPHVLPGIPDWVDEVLLVDGRSTDNTVSLALQLRPDIRILEQEGLGKGAALRTGLLAATGDIVVMLDADGSTDPTEMPAFVGALIAGADFVKGSRFLQGCGTADMPLLRKTGNSALVMLTNLLFHTKFTDITYGYNAVWKDCKDALALEIDGWAQEIISNIRAARAGLRVVEVGSFEYSRIAGEPKLETFSAGWTILKAIFRERFRKLDRSPRQVVWSETQPAISPEVHSLNIPEQMEQDVIERPL